MKITISGTINRIDVIWKNLSTDLTPTKIPSSWFVENVIGYLQAISIKDNGNITYQFGNEPGALENPQDTGLELKPEILNDFCITLKSGYDEIRCHRNTSFTNNALLGLWSTRRKEGDPIEILLEDR